MIGTILSKLLGKGKVFDVISEAVTDKDKVAEIKRDLELASFEIEQELLKDVESARQLGIAETALSLKDPRSWVRPAWAFTALFMWILSMYHSNWVFNYWDYGVVGAIVTYYFGSRLVEKRKAMGVKENLLKGWLK